MGKLMTIQFTLVKSTFRTLSYDNIMLIVSIQYIVFNFSSLKII